MTDFFDLQIQKWNYYTYILLKVYPNDQFQHYDDVLMMSEINEYRKMPRGLKYGKIGIPANFL